MPGVKVRCQLQVLSALVEQNLLLPWNSLTKLGWLASQHMGSSPFLGLQASVTKSSLFILNMVSEGQTQIPHTANDLLTNYTPPLGRGFPSCL